MELKKYIKIGIMILSACLIFKYWGTLMKVLWILLDVASPLLIGCAIAYIINIPMKFLEEKWLSRYKNKFVKKCSHGISMLLAYGGVIISVILILQLIIPELKNCVKLLVKNIPELLDKVLIFVQSNQKISQIIPQNIINMITEDIDWNSSVEGIVTWLQAGFASDIMGYVSSAFSTIFKLFVGIIFSIYILSGKKHLKEQFCKLIDWILNATIRGKVYYFFRVADRNFHNFIVGQCAEAIILGSLCIIGMCIFRFPYAVMIGIMVGCTALIPIAGAYIAAIVGDIMIFAVSPIKAVMFILFFVILQQLEGQLIYPKVVGSSIGLPGIWVFAAVMLGGGLAGIPGILFGIPVASIIYQLIKEKHKKEMEDNI